MSNIANLPKLYKVLSLEVESENIHIDKPKAKVLESPNPNSQQFDTGDSYKSFEKYAV